MTPDLPKNPREELEARLTALLLGELPADEAAALRQAIEQNPELAKLYARLEHTIELVRETAASPAEAAADQPAPLQLAEQRREKLLAHFKTIAPKEFVKPRRRQVSWTVPMAAAAVFMLLVGILAFMNQDQFASTSRITVSAGERIGGRQGTLDFGTWSLKSDPGTPALIVNQDAAPANAPLRRARTETVRQALEGRRAAEDTVDFATTWSGAPARSPSSGTEALREKQIHRGTPWQTVQVEPTAAPANPAPRPVLSPIALPSSGEVASETKGLVPNGTGPDKPPGNLANLFYDPAVPGGAGNYWGRVGRGPKLEEAQKEPATTGFASGAPPALPEGQSKHGFAPLGPIPNDDLHDQSGGLKPDLNGVAAASVPAKPADLELVGEPKATGVLENQGVGSWEKNLSQLSTDAAQSTARRFYRIQPGAGGGGGGGAGNPALKSEISDLKWGLSGNGAGTANQPSAERTGKSDIYTGVTGDNVVGLRLLTPTPAAPPPASLPSLVPSPEVVVAPPVMSSPINPETVSAKVDQPAKGAITGFAHGIDPSTPPPPVPGAVFLGYDDPGKFVPQALAASGGTVGVPVTSQLPLPHWRVGDKDFYGEPEGNKTPFLGDLPLVGRLFRSESGPADDRAKSSSTRGAATPGLAAGKPVDVDFDTSAAFDTAAALKLGLNNSGLSSLSLSAANSFGGAQVSDGKTRSYVNDGTVVNAGTLALGERKELGSTTLSGYVDSSAQWNIGTGNAITTPIGGGPSGYDVSVWSDNTAVKTTGFANIGGDQQKPEPQVAIPRSKTDGFNQNVTTPAQVEAKPQRVELPNQVGHEPAAAGGYSFQLANADPQQTKALLEDLFQKNSNTSNTRGGSPSESPSLAQRRAGGSGGNQTSIALPSVRTEGRAAGEATFSIDQDSHKLVVVADEETGKYVSQIVTELDSSTKGTPHPSANRPAETSKTEERLMLGRHDDAARPVSKAEPAPQDSLLTSGLRIPATKAAKEEPARRKLAEVTKQPSEGKSAEDRAKAATKVRDAAVLFELGKLDESAAKLKEAIKTDPANQQAYYYVNLIQESQYKEAQKKRDVSSRHSLVEVEEAWFTPPKHELVTAPNSFARSTQIASSKGSNNIAKKLDQIHLGSVKYEGLPLSEVIYSLNDESKKRDPDKRGLNFIIAPGILSAAGTNGTPSPVDPATGLPAAAAAPAEDQDLGAVQVKIAKPLGDVRLVDALDAIVKAADKPIKYSIEDYGVVFSPAGPAPERKKEPDLPKQTRPAAPAAEPQPEVQTCDNAFSTFSLNISDVSFKLAMASLEKGLIPEAASVRSEEFLNAFDYRDPEPPPGAPIGFAWERARYPYAQNRDLLRFSLKTAALGRQPGRPLNLVLLLDNSGSMERADRVRIIHEALRVLAGQLQAQDKFSVVTFSRTARLIVDGVSGNEAGRVVEEISGLTPQGGTNLEDAMNTAYATALRHYLANGVNRVVLLTDGAANLGNVEPDALKQKVEAHRKQGIALDCFGIGWEGYNDDLLEVLSRNGDGRYGFINTPEEATTEFASQLAGALHVAASDVKVQIEFNPKRVTAYRQIGYAKHQLTKQQFRDNTVDAAEIAAAEAGNALYVVEVNPRGEGPLGTVRVRYKVPGTTDYHEHEWEAPYTGNAVALEQASPAMRLAATSSAFSEWLVSSPYAGEVTPDNLLGYLSGVPEVYGADIRPKKLEWMIRQAKSVVGK